MANKTFKGRISNKHDTSANWLTASNNGFIPLDGEIIIYDDLNRIKIGDGSTKVDKLPFLNYSEEEIQELINDSLSELTYTEAPSIDYIYPYVKNVEQKNGLIETYHGDLINVISPIIIEIDENNNILSLSVNDFELFHELLSRRYIVVSSPTFNVFGAYLHSVNIGDEQEE